VAGAFVVDASVAVKWHLPDEDDADIAFALLDQFEQGEVDLLAPYHIRYEVGSAITVATLGRGPRLSRVEGELAIAEFLALQLQTRTDDALIPSAHALVHQHGCAFYDALYLALADRLQLPFITADRRLHQRIGHLPNVVWLGDYVPPPVS
jgi:predicted nucleic acid-binding protein